MLHVVQGAGGKRAMDRKAHPTRIPGSSLASHFTRELEEAAGDPGPSTSFPTMDGDRSCFIALLISLRGREYGGKPRGHAFIADIGLIAGIFERPDLLMISASVTTRSAASRFLGNPGASM